MLLAIELVAAPPQRKQYSTKLEVFLIVVKPQKPLELTFSAILSAKDLRFSIK